jgi:membrane glycosyltransferase
MHSVNIFCHEFVVAVSFVACILGLLILWNSKQQKDEMEETERILFRMSFTYWLVYCVAFGLEKMVLPSWEPIVMSLKITTALSYFLTFSCILSLPLHRFAIHQVEE